MERSGGRIDIASSKEYLDFILEQLSELDEITYRGMMGEYIIYYRGKVIGGIYDDRFALSRLLHGKTVLVIAHRMRTVEAADNVEITTAKGGHAIGGLCGYAGTHSDAEKMMEETGVEVTEYPSLIHDCEVDAVINVDGATHVGGLIGTNLYFFGEETTWKAYDCTVKAEIAGAVMPGSLFGRAENCEYSDCSYEVTLDGEPLENEVGETDVMYESLDQ